MNFLHGMQKGWNAKIKDEKSSISHEISLKYETRKNLLKVHGEKEKLYLHDVGLKLCFFCCFYITHV